MKNQLPDNNDLDFDVPTLLEHCTKQAKLVGTWGTKEAEYKRRVAELKNDLEILKAQVAAAVRDDPEGYGLDKVTIDAVSGAVLQDEDVQAAEKELRNAIYETDVVRSYVIALSDKRRMLEAAIRLHGIQWYGEDVHITDPQMKAAVDKMDKQEIRSRGRARTRKPQ